jgi:tetratricopeptide (TPR) repeat protein
MAYAALAAAYYHQGRKHLVPAVAKKAIEIAPRSNPGPVWLNRFHLMSGNYPEAIQLMNDILVREPLFFVARVHIAEALRQQGRYAAALQEADRVLDQDQQNFHGLTVAALIQFDQGALDAAAITLDKFRPADRNSYVVRLLRALLFALRGQRANALATLDPEVLKFARFIQWTTLAAECYSILDDQPKAIEWLELAVRNGDERLEWFRRDPLLANVRSNPRFQQLLNVIQQRQQSQ